VPLKQPAQAPFAGIDVFAWTVNVVQEGLATVFVVDEEGAVAQRTWVV
jgi:hypothetical protein